ncbi:efflux RND transporter periplasmic adaptor subunit [Lacipirellula sp.]|uniref:efflux RND transporter periplasmic adaptor subunit n=1 Tax=Lacipirellula sp. TaxID=2691419 RepID=UPI003D109B6D
MPAIARSHSVIACIAASVLAAAFSGCSPATPAAPKSEATAPVTPKEVEVVAAQLLPWPRTVTVQGALLADEDAVLGSKLAGRVATVSVDLGSIVKKGDPLVALDRSELNLQVKLAEAQLQQACAAIGITPNEDETKLDFDDAPPVQLEQALVDEAQAAVNRARALVPTRAITGGEYDTLVAQLRAAKARYNSALNSVSTQVALIGVRRTELSLAKQQVIDSQLIAPFDGVVEARRVSPGEYVSMGQPLIALVRAERLRFTAGVPESQARQIKTGQKVEIQIAGVAEPILTAVTRVSPIVTQTSRAVRIEADVPNPDHALQAGLFAKADVIVDAEAQALALPESAVTRFAGVEKVWVVADGQAAQKSIRTGRQERGRVEILDGLPAGSEVVANAEQGRTGPVTHKAVSGQLSAISQKAEEPKAPAEEAAAPTNTPSTPPSG